MNLLESIIATTLEGTVLDVCIGIHWTAVVMNVNGEKQCGLASTRIEGHTHKNEPDVPAAGKLLNLSSKQIVEFSRLSKPILSSIGVAAINALLPVPEQPWQVANAEEVLTCHGLDKKVVMVGRFPFINRLRKQVGELVIIEQDPQAGDLPAKDAYKVLPGAEVVAITGMTLINHTLEELLSYCDPNAFVMVLGPSTPLSPVLFGYGVDVISGSYVDDVDAVLRMIKQGGNFRQIHLAGVRLVNISRNSLL